MFVEKNYGILFHIHWKIGSCETFKMIVDCCCALGNLFKAIPFSDFFLIEIMTLTCHCHAWDKKVLGGVIYYE